MVVILTKLANLFFEINKDVNFIHIRNLAEKTNAGRKRERQDHPKATCVPSASRAGQRLAKNLIREPMSRGNPKMEFSQEAEVEGKNPQTVGGKPEDSEHKV